MICTVRAVRLSLTSIRQPDKNWIVGNGTHGSQFIALDVARTLEQLHIEHEFTHPSVPEENAFIESWHSIFQREVTDRYEFDSFEQARQTIERHRHWYQFERVHGSLNYQTPHEFVLAFQRNNIIQHST
jgi:transposase InsO family protein